MKIKSLIWHYYYYTREIINTTTFNSEDEKKLKRFLLCKKVNILKNSNEGEKLCRLYFFVDSDLKSSLKIKDEEEWHNYLKQFNLKVCLIHGTY